MDEKKVTRLCTEPNKFPPGTRVRVYGSFGSLTLLALKGEVFRTRVMDEKIEIRLDGGEIVIAHPKQCRRLVKRERRRVWVLESQFQRLESGRSEYRIWVETDPGNLKCQANDNFIEFIEVKKK